jgi:aspartyl-tRNA synthetase
MTNHVLGTIRNDLGRPPVHEGGLHFVWVVDFPLFEAISEDGTVHPAHHPFTAPHPDDLQLLARASASRGEELLSVRSLSYDLVLNGWELGSGSVRIHRADLQQQIFTILGIDEATARARFGFLLDAFRFGAPPHAGFAFGIDRLVAILAGEDNIREVIAYPKTQSGADPLTGAPTAVDDLQLRELGITLRKAPAGPTSGRVASTPVDR